MRFLMFLLSLGALVLNASVSKALTGGAGDEGDRLSRFNLTTATRPDDLVSTLQWPIPQSPQGFSLAGQGLLGRYGLTAKDVLQELAPHLSACTPRLERSSSTGETVHEYYAIYFGDYPLAGALLHLHHHQNQLALVRASLPSYRLPAKKFTDRDFVPAENLGYVAGEGEHQTARKVLADSSGFPAPAWEISRFTVHTGITVTQLIDAQTGALLQSSAAAFDLAEVFAHGPKDGSTIAVELPDLPGTGYLDGKHFQVLAPTLNDPRVMAPDNQFNFLPNDPADALNFDQVQAYYTATRAMAWFQTKFGDDSGNAHIILRINDIVGGRADNALYVPPPAGPEIQVGAGNEALTNLARDTDVITHEFSHHIIYEHLKSHEGESGVLHEGTSDYFAYAINGDPNLGESLVPGGAYLRTANLASDDLYDQVDERRGAHFRGQYWSAVLWSLRQTLGESVDTMVYNALAYLGPSSGLKEAFLGLLNADRDLNPLEAGALDFGVFGKNKCLILSTAVARGFAQYLDDYDGLSCGLDLANLAAASRERSEPPAVEGRGKPVTFTAFGKQCAVVDGGLKPGGLTPAAWFLLPLLFGLCRDPRKKKHGS